MTTQHTYDYPMSSATATVIPYLLTDDRKELNILCVRRKENPFIGKLALPGGFQSTGKESLEDTARRELYEETLIKTAISKNDLVTVQSEPERDPLGVIIDHVYAVEITINNLLSAVAGDDAASLELFTIMNFRNKKSQEGFDWGFILNGFAFDHAESILKFIKKL